MKVANFQVMKELVDKGKYLDTFNFQEMIEGSANEDQRLDAIPFQFLFNFPTLKKNSYKLPHSSL